MTLMFHWTSKEIKALIAIWSKPEYQEMLDATRKNIDIFQEIAEELNNSMPDQRSTTAEKCRSKIKSLRSDYRKARAHHNIHGDGPSRFRFYREMDKVMGDRPATEPQALLDTSSVKQERYDNNILDSGNYYDHYNDDQSDTEPLPGLEHNKRRGSEEVPDINSPKTKQRKIDSEQSDDNNFDDTRDPKSTFDTNGHRTPQLESEPDDTEDVTNKGVQLAEYQQPQPLVTPIPTKPFIINTKNNKKKDNASELMNVFLKMEERSMDKLQAMDKEMKEREKEEERRFQARMREMEVEQERRRWEKEDQRKQEEDERRNQQQMFQMQMANMFAALTRPAASTMGMPHNPGPFQPEFFAANYGGQEYDSLGARTGEPMGVSRKAMGSGPTRPQPGPRLTQKPLTRPGNTTTSGGASRMPQRVKVGAAAHGGDDSEKLKKLNDQLAEMRSKVEDLEKERDLYFGQLRDIEVLCQQPDSEMDKQSLIKATMDIIYATEDRLGGPVEDNFDGVAGEIEDGQEEY